MHTFLPYASYEASARCLDDRRLAYQCLLARRLVDKILGAATMADQKMPVFRMWQDHVESLIDYHNQCSIVAHKRGIRMVYIIMHAATPVAPHWLGDERLHSSHRSNLLRKDPKHYGMFNWTDPVRKGYFWPSSSNTVKH